MGPPINITNNPGDDYGPYIYYDATRSKQWLAYSKWHNNQGGLGNDLVLQYRDSVADSWITAKNPLIGGDGHDYGIPSILVLQNGNILVFYTKDSPKSLFGQKTNAPAKLVAGTGTIQLIISTNGGFSWSNPITPTYTCDAEYTRAIQDSNGAILMVFSRYADVNYIAHNSHCVDWWDRLYPKSYIHEIWSENEGYTWTQERVLLSANDSLTHPLIYPGSQHPQDPCPTCQWHLLYLATTANGWHVFDRKSTNEGSLWQLPNQISLSSSAQPFNIDPSFTVGCRGPVFGYTSGYPGQNVYIRRYELGNDCD